LGPFGGFAAGAVAPLPGSPDRSDRLADRKLRGATCRLKGFHGCRRPDFIGHHEKRLAQLAEADGFG
jgi:hypothetical protein